MIPFHNPTPSATAHRDDSLAGPLVHQFDRWTPPTPRLADAPAATRAAARAASRAVPTAPLSRWQRIGERLDIVGWLLGGQGERLMMMTEDPSDPRVIIYNRIVSGAWFYTGPQAVLLRYATGRY